MGRILLVVVIFLALQMGIEGVNILPELILPTIIFFLMVRTVYSFAKHRRPYESGRDRYRKVMAKSKRRR